MRGHHWALAVEHPRKWREMTAPPDAVPYVGCWRGRFAARPGFRFTGYYLFPFALRVARQEQ